MQFAAVEPAVFPSPFDVRPHEIANEAAMSLQSRLPEICGELKEGKMFGVLAVRSADGETGYLSAFSGMLDNQWKLPAFVPPVFDPVQWRSVLSKGDAEFDAFNGGIEKIRKDPEYHSVVGKLAEFDEQSDVVQTAMKARNANRKQERSQLRASRDADLAALANQSREDKQQFKALKDNRRALRSEYSDAVEVYDSQLRMFERGRAQHSFQLQSQLFNLYRLQSFGGEIKNIKTLFDDKLPPSGAGDCAAVKLLNYANVNELNPIAMAEFWWGPAPTAGLRQHGRFYPSCRSRCRHLLPFMLDGRAVSIPKHEQDNQFPVQLPETLFEDEEIVLVEKPAGMLSVPGKTITDSVETRLKARYPEAQGAMLLHRLDQATSGVMMAAKNPRARTLLQHQFQDRTVEKRYVAVLDGRLDAKDGEVDLPLRIDFYDRPRQIVCVERGKSALTRFEVLSSEKNSGTVTTRVHFYPHTGRTHQLRVHAAHPDGLNCPILGDELYGRPLERLYLHAQQISFDHPVSNKRITVSSDTPF